MNQLEQGNVHKIALFDIYESRYFPIVVDYQTYLFISVFMSSIPLTHNPYSSILQVSFY
jgi:hypothetical protein